MSRKPGRIIRSVKSGSRRLARGVFGFSRSSGYTNQVVTDVQRRVQHPVLRWMGATLDGIVEGTGAVFEAKFMLPWAFSEEAAAAKHMAQLQHNMWVTSVKLSALSIITAVDQPQWMALRHPLFNVNLRKQLTRPLRSASFPSPASLD